MPNRKKPECEKKKYILSVPLAIQLHEKVKQEAQMQNISKAEYARRKLKK